MSRYVDVDILINKMQERYNDLLSENGYYDNFTQGYEDALSEVENEPTADVREVKHGKWIGKPISGYADCKCSVCGAVCNVRASVGIPAQKYCYRCGAKMDLEEDGK